MKLSGSSFTEEHNPAMLETISDNTTSPLQPLVYYIRTSWGNNSVWPVAPWSIFGLAVQTVTWKIGTTTQQQMKQQQFLQAHQLLHGKTRLINLQTHFIAHNRLSRFQQNIYKHIQASKTSKAVATLQKQRNYNWPPPPELQQDIDPLQLYNDVTEM